MAITVELYSVGVHGVWPYGHSSGGRRVAFVRDAAVVCLHEIDPVAPLGVVTDAQLLARRADLYRGAPCETDAEYAARLAVEGVAAAEQTAQSGARAALQAALTAIRAKAPATRSDAEKAVIAIVKILREDS